MSTNMVARRLITIDVACAIAADQVKLLDTQVIQSITLSDKSSSDVHPPLIHSPPKLTSPTIIRIEQPWNNNDTCHTHTIVPLLIHIVYRIYIQKLRKTLEQEYN